MIETLIYAAGFVGTAYPVAHVVAHYDVQNGNDPDPDSWVIAAIVGLICAFLWPFVLAAGLVFLVSRGLWTGQWALPWKLPARPRADAPDDHDWYPGDADTEAGEDRGTPGSI